MLIRIQILRYYWVNYLVLILLRCFLVSFSLSSEAIFRFYEDFIATFSNRRLSQAENPPSLSRLVIANTGIEIFVSSNYSGYLTRNGNMIGPLPISNQFAFLFFGGNISVLRSFHLRLSRFSQSHRLYCAVRVHFFFISSS